VHGSAKFFPFLFRAAGSRIAGMTTPIPLACVCVAALAGLAAAPAAAPEREATLAVVNPVLRSPLRQTLSLEGEWDFAADPAQVGEAQRWFGADAPLPNQTTLRVPGCWEAQGVGGPGQSSPVTPERSIRPLRGAFDPRNPGKAWKEL
jgi:hypothetical protein